LSLLEVRMNYGLSGFLFHVSETAASTVASIWMVAVSSRGKSYFTPRNRSGSSGEYHSPNVVILAKAIQNGNDPVASLVEKYSRNKLSQVFLVHVVDVVLIRHDDLDSTL
jgi:hypothetical protein